jgi:hypothetical protein
MPISFLPISLSLSLSLCVCVCVCVSFSFSIRVIYSLYPLAFIALPSLLLKLRFRPSYSLLFIYLPYLPIVLIHLLLLAQGSLYYP